MGTRSLRLSLLGLCLVAPVALAAGLSDYEPIFPTNPCQDGWAACIVNGDSVTADPTKDAAGRPLPSDLRVGWFDLEATAALSPGGNRGVVNEIGSSGSSAFIATRISGRFALA